MNYYITFLFIWISGTVFSQIDRLEPPFWWAGMEHTEVQLICYGNNIAAYEVASEDLTILEVKQVENKNYLFITIDTQGKPAGTYSLYFNNGKNQPFRRDYELKTRTANSAQREGFDASDVIYLLMPDRFANGNPSNDSTPDTEEKADRSKNGGRHGGDIKGIIDHLDYLEELGVTALWSTPLLEDNEPIYSYHTYAQSDYYTIDPRYGSNEDYKELADNMHERGMKLIMDYVTNHWGSKHWMIQDLPMKDWIHTWEDGDRTGFKRSNYRMTTQFDSNASTIDAQGCMNGWFDTTMPDMNQANPLVLKYMLQNAIWWIEYAGLDGFRVDTYSYNDKEAIATWTKAIMNEYPNFNIMGEVWMHDQAQISYWQKDSKIGAIDGYNSGCPTVMDFTLHDAILAMFDEAPGWDKGLIRAYDNFSNDFLYSNTNNLLVFAGNHDTNRINECYGSDLDIYKQIMTLIFTVRGIPQIYYGDEIGMLGNKEILGDGDIRKDFPGGWNGDAQNAFTEKGRTDTQNAFHTFTKKVLNWRKEKEVIHTGEFLHYIPFEDVYVYFRYNATDRVMVVLNNTSEEKTLAMERFSEGIQGAKSGRDIISETTLDLSESLKIPAKGSMIIDLK